MNKVSAVLIIINFVTVLFPQPGYIHPDEFFQSTEIVAGDILNITHYRAWEFNESSPIRSIVFPYMLLSPSLYFLKWINFTGIREFRISAVKIVIATRLPFAFLSLSGFIATEKLAKVFDVNQYWSAVLYSSSYVTWTYMTRTFSNSVEACLLAVILILIFSCLDYLEYLKRLKLIQKSNETRLSRQCYEAQTHEQQKKGVKKKESQDADIEGTDTSKQSHVADEHKIKSDIAHTTKENLDEGDFRKLKFNVTKDEKLKQELFEKEIHSCRQKLTLCHFFMGFFVTAGFFNRPTFLAFSLVPVLFCLHFSNGFRNPIKILMTMGAGASLCSAVFILCDSAYYNSDFVRSVKVCIDMIVTEQFSQNTLRTCFELLSSSLIITPWNFLKYNMNTDNLSEHGLHARYTHCLVNLPLLIGPLFISLFIIAFSAAFRSGTGKKHSLKWLVSMAILPVVLLSVFPHQEPRFLIPGLPFFMVIGTQFVSSLKFGKGLLLTVWAFFNLAMLLVYGYLHQAALIPTLSNYQLKFASSPSSYHHAIFYKTYPPPRHLLIIDSTKPNVRLDDLAGAPIEILLEKVRLGEDICRKNKDNCQLSVFLPATATSSLTNHISDYQLSSICPHLSMESPPRLKSWWENKLSFDDFIMDFCLSIVTIR